MGEILRCIRHHHLRGFWPKLASVNFRSRSPLRLVNDFTRRNKTSLSYARITPPTILTRTPTLELENRCRGGESILKPGSARFLEDEFLGQNIKDHQPSVSVHDCDLETFERECFLRHGRQKRYRIMVVEATKVIWKHNHVRIGVGNVWCCSCFMTLGFYSTTH